MTAPAKVRSPYDDALEWALADLAEARERLEGLKRAVRSQEVQVATLRDLALRLAEVAAPEDANTEKTLRDLAPASISTRGGELFTNVVNLFDGTRRREWSAGEVQAELTARGQATDTKALHNVLNYLARKGRLKRIGRGQYLDVESGAGFFADPTYGDGDFEGGCINE